MATKIISFADSRLKSSIQRFTYQALQMEAFDEVEVFSEENFTREFQIRFADYLKPGIRGFGYWVWKPWIIKSELEKLAEGDLLVYADVGFNINPSGAPRLEEYLTRVRGSESGVLGFQAIRPQPDSPIKDDGRSLPAWFDKYWTKGDLLDYFNVRSSANIIDSPTIQTGLILFRKCEFSISFVQEWMNVFETNFHLIDDTKSISPNEKGFREHRHDQAVFSILGKLRQIDTVSSNEFWMPKWWSSKADWEALSGTPFHATRDLVFDEKSKQGGSNSFANSGVSIKSLKYNFILLGKRIANLFKPIHKRFL